MTRKKINRILVILVMMMIFAINKSNVDAAGKIKMSSENEVLPIGKSVTLSLNGATGTVKWSTSDKNIVNVTSKGRIKALKKGTAKITATYNKKQYVCNVQVITNFDNMFNMIRDTGTVNSNGYKSILKEFDNRMYSLTYIKDKREFEFKYLYDDSKATYVVVITIPRNGARIVPMQITYVNNKNGAYFYGKADIRRSLYSKTYNVPLEVTKASGRYYRAYVKNTNIACRRAFAAWNSIIGINNLGFKKY